MATLPRRMSRSLGLTDAVTRRWWMAAAVLGTSVVLSACGADGAANCVGCGEDGDAGTTGPRRDTGITTPGDDTGPQRDVPDGGTTPPELLCDARTCDQLAALGLPLTDTDSDGVPDCVEGLADLDGDGLPNCADDDSDGDSIPDLIEGTGDSDGDGIPDFLDTDTDGDGIPDRFEGNDDPDEDGIPNYLDPDSDGDGWPDAVEYGQAPGSGERPVDRDGDGIPDFRDLDSDGDGIADINEPGCPAGPDRALADSDGDNFTDLIEIAFGSDPCDPTSDIRTLVDFYFRLPYLGDEPHATLDFSTDLRQGDVAFIVDTTGSMGGEINNLKSALSSRIIPGVSARIPDVGIGVARFDDFPTSPFGSPGDQPFRLLQRITTVASEAQAGANALTTASGGDGPESHYEAFYQAFAGTPRSECNWSYGGEAWGDGSRGGLGFRPGSAPIAVLISDAPAHARNEGGYNCGASREDAYAAASAIGGRVVGVASGGPARTDLEQMAVRTGAVVPTCAWDAGRCGGRCCTGQNGGGRAPGADGLCPLVFDIDGNGNGMGDAVVEGIQALVQFAPIDVTTRVSRDEVEFAASGIDTSLFIKSIVPVAADAGVGSCSGSSAPIEADFDGDGVNDGFRNVTPGSTVFFDIGAYNGHVRPSNIPQVFTVYIDVIGNGGAVLDTRIASILVPPEIKQ